MDGRLQAYEVCFEDWAEEGRIVPDGMGAGGRTVAPGWPPV